MNAAKPLMIGAGAAIATAGAVGGWRLEQAITDNGKALDPPRVAFGVLEPAFGLTVGGGAAVLMGGLLRDAAHLGRWRIPATAALAAIGGAGAAMAGVSLGVAGGLSVDVGRRLT